MARSDSTSRGFAVAGILTLVLGGGGLAAAAASADAGTPAAAPPPEGLQVGGPRAVAGPDGVVGSIPEDDWERAVAEGPPYRTYGTAQVSLQSLEVFDEADLLVGYYTTGSLGFVPLATAEDPAAMDQLLEGLPPKLTQTQAQELNEQLRSSAH